METKLTLEEELVLNKAAKFADRKNSGKVDTSFNPRAATLEWAKVWMFGAKKYARDQWKKLWGDQTINLALASANRHLLEIQEGNLFDEESGQTHAAHVMCNMAMIIEYMANQGMINPSIYEEKET